MHRPYVIENTNERERFYIFNHHSGDVAFEFEHPEHFITKLPFNLTGIRHWADHEGGTIAKAAKDFANFSAATGSRLKA